MKGQLLYMIHSAKICGVFYCSQNTIYSFLYFTMKNYNSEIFKNFH